MSMKILVVYYSRTGTTKKIATAIASHVDCDLEEIGDVADRSGLVGYMKSGKEASLKQLPDIKAQKKDPADYDLVVIGTPIWAWDVASPVRTYLTRNAGKIKKAAFFCTMGGSGDKGAFKTMEGFCGTKPKATLVLRTKEVVQNAYAELVKDFAKKLR